MRRYGIVIGLPFWIGASLPTIAHAQSRVLRVVSVDSAPVIYAFVSVDGGGGRITDENGRLSLGAGKRTTVTVDIRRIGFQPFSGRIDLPDTAATIIVSLRRLAQALGEIRIADTASVGRVGLKLQGFYDRWLMRQKGTLSATFIGPEEIESRHPDRITNMLRGLNGVSFRQNEKGQLVALGYNGQCQMAIIVDGVRQCPSKGCKCDQCGANITQIPGRGPPASVRIAPAPGSEQDFLGEDYAVLIDNILAAGDVAAIEVYARGANMPVSLQVSDAACGAIAFWTGSRRP